MVPRADSILARHPNVTGDGFSKLECNRDTLPTADTQSGYATTCVTRVHGMQQCDEHARAGGTDRVSKCNRATFNIDAGRTQLSFLPTASF